jgi:predicted  nucleic acid-binding Zn-ribbon protein
MIDDAIRSLLHAPRCGAEAPTLDDIEDKLTAGYARALALDAERRRLERRLAETAAKLNERASEESEESEESEVAELGRRLSVTDGDLAELRRLLSSLRVRADEVRTAA